MARQALKTDDIKIEQKDAIDLNKIDPSAPRADIVIADKSLNKDYLDSLAFYEEPVLIRIEPSSDPNAPGAYPAWVNGKGAEVLINDKWCEATWLSVGIEYTIKRKYLANLLRAKSENVQTNVVEQQGQDPQNHLLRPISRLATVSILEDKNPKGHAWATEVIRRRY